MGVLDEMTKGLTDRKAAKAGPTLTPVGTEASPTKPSQVGIPEVPEVFLTNEAVRDIARELRDQAATLVKVADALDLQTQESSNPPIRDGKAERDLQKAIEKAADEKFADRFDRLKAEAIASLDATDTVGEPHEGNPNTPEVSATGGWQCPEHGDTNLKQLTSRKGREYTACQVAGCESFEK